MPGRRTSRLTRAVRHSGMDAGIQGWAGGSVKLGRCAGCGLPSVALGPGIHAGTTEVAVDRAVRHSGMDAGIQGWAGGSVKRGRCAGCGLPSVALGPGIHAGTTEIAVNRAVRHSGLDAGIQGRAEVIGQTRALCWLRVTVRGTGSRHPCRDDGHRG